MFLKHTNNGYIEQKTLLERITSAEDLRTQNSAFGLNITTGTSDEMIENVDESDSLVIFLKQIDLFHLYPGMARAGLTMVCYCHLFICNL